MRKRIKKTVKVTSSRLINKAKDQRVPIVSMDKREEKGLFNNIWK